MTTSFRGEYKGCSDGMVDVQMKYAKGIGLHKSRSALLGASLCSVVGLCTACTAETQPLDPVADDAGGGSGTGGSSGAPGGSSASGGTSGGSGEQRDVLAEKLDILFVVDNSMLMDTKQPYLASAAAQLLERLVNPRCIDGDDPALAAGCPEGQHREFAPVTDMHIGVISSSLGGHGGDVCSPNGNDAASYNPTKNDAGKLMPTVREGLPSYQGQGFLAWDLLEVDEEAEHDLGTLQTAVSEQILSVGSLGCGYEAPLEAMYRFLIDPSPPQEIVVTENQAYPATDADGNVLVDTEVLEQRADFLRPDSALAIVLLSDEDDCSVREDGVPEQLREDFVEEFGYQEGRGLGWLTASTFTLPRATEACAADPNDACCRSCGVAEESPPDGCTRLEQDANCIEGPLTELDSLNLRCFDQQRRFGFDLLYPVDRYVAGLTKTQIEDPWSCGDLECPLVRNPLFPPENPDLAFTRRASEVFMISLVGVPWQDLATSESLTGDGLTYKSTFDADDWNLVVGDPSSYVAPEDPLMVGSIDPRSGTHPVTGEPVAPVHSTNPTENSINGHEFFSFDNTQLQYACTFPLVSPKDCTGNSYPCECTDNDLAANKPLCQPPGGGEATTTQYYGAAMPGLRVLDLMSKLPRGVPASICPKVVEGDADAAAYGYNPAMHSLVRELSSVLK